MTAKNNDEGTTLALRKEVITTAAFDRGTTGILLSLCTLAGIAVGFSVSNIASAVQMSKPKAEVRAASHYSSVAPAWLGIVVRSDLDSNGAKVVKVTPGSPAAKSGVLPGDTILTVAGQRTKSATSVVRSVRSQEPYDIVQMTVRSQDNGIRTAYARLDLMPSWVFRKVRHQLSLRCISALGGEQCRLR